MTSHAKGDQSEVVYLATLQFSNGGLLDSEPTDGVGHLIRGTYRGTPGHTLCGIDRWPVDADGKLTGPGWAVGGGCCQSGQPIPPCSDCVAAARRDFPGVPVAGMRELSQPLAEAIGVAWHHHMMDVPAIRTELRERQEAAR